MSFEFYDTLITPAQACEMLNCGMSTMYKLLAEKKLKAMRIGRFWKIPRRSIQEFIIQETQMKAAGW